MVKWFQLLLSVVYMVKWFQVLLFNTNIALSAGAVEYADCTSAGG